MKKLALLCLYSGLTLANPTGEVLMQDIYDHLDFTSYPNSMNPKTGNNETHFSDFKGEFKLPSPVITENQIVIEDEDWLYSVKYLDEYKNDIYLCVFSQSKTATYLAQSPIVVRKYGEDYVALALDPTPIDGGCDEYAR